MENPKKVTTMIKTHYVKGKNTNEAIKNLWKYYKDSPYVISKVISIRRVSVFEDKYVVNVRLKKRQRRPRRSG